jgi:hypothetical protein
LYNQKLPRKNGENPIYFNTLDDYIYYVKTQRVEKNQYCPVLYLQKEINTQGQEIFRARPNPFNLQGGLPSSPASDTNMIKMISNFFKDRPQTSNTSSSQNLGNVQSLQNGPNPYNTSSANSVTLNMPGTQINKNEQSLMMKQKVPPNLKANYVDSNRDHKPYNQGQYGFDPYGQYVGRYTQIDQLHDKTKLDKKSSNPMDTNWGGGVYTSNAVVKGNFKDNEVYPPNRLPPANKLPPQNRLPPANKLPSPAANQNRLSAKPMPKQ